MTQAQLKEVTQEAIGNGSETARKFLKYLRARKRNRPEPLRLGQLRAHMGKMNLKVTAQDLRTMFAHFEQLNLGRITVDNQYSHPEAFELAKGITLFQLRKAAGVYGKPETRVSSGPRRPKLTLVKSPRPVAAEHTYAIVGQSGEILSVTLPALATAHDRAMLAKLITASL